MTFADEDGFGNTPFSGGCYAEIYTHRVKRIDSLRRWLEHLSIPGDRRVFAVPVFAGAEDPIVALQFKTVVRHSSSLFSSDNLIIADQAGSWCIYYHHDGLVTCAVGRNTG